MELFIQIRNGQPFEHPIFGDNFRQAFPNVDTENLPPEFARFVRINPPTIGIFDVCEVGAYELVDGAYTDVYTVRAMTDEEKVAKIAEAKARLPDNWTLNEETLQPSPPPKPTTGGPWQFDRVANIWKEAPVRPEGEYRFDYVAWQWVEIAQ